MSGKQSNDTRDIYVLQDPPEGHRAEFDWGYADLVIHGSLRKCIFRPDLSSESVQIEHSFRSS